jgi:hypothetical protein
MQESLLLWMKEGDTPTQFFHAHVNAHRRRNFIHSFFRGGEVLVLEDSKAEAFFNFYDELLGAPVSRTYAINLGMLDLPRLNLSHLGECFTEEEIWTVIRAMPVDKAPGPDGFTTRFLQLAWPVTRADVMQVFDTLWHLDTRNIHDLNEALLVLLPKSVRASSVKDYWPITLIHTISKLVSKVLTSRLAPRLGELIHANQSAFVKGIFIQDNFKMVQWTPEWLHAKKKLSMLLKVDIAQAFDSVVCPFLLELLEHMGFLHAWREWILALLSSASTRILLNGNPGDKICHAKGLHQGDPLPSMLFLLVMEVLNALICKVEAWSLFNLLGLSPGSYRASFYADDLILSLSLEQDDIQMTHAIRSIFERSSGLSYNPSKCQLAPIQCSKDQVALATSLFPCQ